MHFDFFFKTMTQLVNFEKPQEQQFQICSEKSQEAKKLCRSMWPWGAVLIGEGRRAEGRQTRSLFFFLLRKRKLSISIKKAKRP